MPTYRDPEGREIDIKPAFKERYEKLTDFDAFIQCSLTFLRKSIRVNTIKASVADVKKRLSRDCKLQAVPWCKEGFYITHKDGRRDIGNTKEHGLGYFYVQEAASMIPPIVLEPRPGDVVLDMCAAPGSKTTQIGMYMKNRGILVANDIRGDRLQALGINVQRCGLTNCIVTQMNGVRFRRLGPVFDRILVDAPCSGTGTIRKSFKTLRMWNANMIRKLAGQQRGLLFAAWEALKPGGTLVYSTCTLEPEENEGVLDVLLGKHDDAVVQDITLPVKHEPAITEFGERHFHDHVSKCLRLWPQENDTEGFFVAKLTKNLKK